MTKADWGDVACLCTWSSYWSRDPIAKLTDVAVKVGRKYVTITDGWNRKFDIENGQEISNYTSDNRIFPSRKHAELFLKQREIKKQLSKYLTWEACMIIDQLPIERQEQILQMFIDIEAK